MPRHPPKGAIASRRQQLEAEKRRQDGVDDDQRKKQRREIDRLERDARAVLLGTGHDSESTFAHS